MTRTVGEFSFQTGISLHQALITLTIAATLGVLAIPTLRPVLASQRMNTSVNTLVTALHLTRSEAIHQRARASLCPTLNNSECLDSYSDWHQGFMVYIDHNANRRRDEDEPIVRTFRVNRNIQLRSSRGRDHITYQPNGLASGTNATFVFCDSGQATKPRRVVVANSGRPRVLPAREPSSC